MRGLALPIVLLLTGLAGCASQAPDAPGDVADSAPGEQVLSAPLMVPDASELLATATFTGTFTLQDSQQINGLVEQDGPVHRHALDMLPPGVPLLIHIEAVAQTVGDIDVGLQGDAAVWRSDCDCPLGPRNERWYYLRADGPLDLLIQYDEHGQESEFDYTIDVTLSSSQEQFQPGVPVGIQLSAGETVTTDGFALVHDPDDVRIAEVSRNTFTAPTDGEYVLVPSEELVISSNATAPQMRLLPLRMEMSEELDVATSMSATFQAVGATVEVGFCVFAGEMTADPSVELNGPDGVLFTGGADGPQMLGDWGECVEIATAELSDYVGEYELVVTCSADAGGDAYTWQIQWDR